MKLGALGGTTQLQMKARSRPITETQGRCTTHNVDTDKISPISLSPSILPQTKSVHYSKHLEYNVDPFVIGGNDIDLLRSENIYLLRYDNLLTFVLVYATSTASHAMHWWPDISLVVTSLLG